MSQRSEAISYYYLVPNLQALDPSAREMDASATAWVQPTVIDDDDLTFGGKSLSDWYEEDRRRLSSSSSNGSCCSHSVGGGSSSGEEERRGRERVRRQHPSQKSSGKK